jgi:hypothetical protein
LRLYRCGAEVAALDGRGVLFDMLEIVSQLDR